MSAVRRDAQYAAGAGYRYAGDCQRVDAGSAGQVCSLAFVQDSERTLVQFFTVAADGTAVQPAVATFTVPAATLSDAAPPGH